MTVLGALFTLLLRYHVIQQLVAQLILACSIYASRSWPIKQVSEVPQLFRIHQRVTQNLQLTSASELQKFKAKCELCTLVSFGIYSFSTDLHGDL